MTSLQNRTRANKSYKTFLAARRCRTSALLSLTTIRAQELRDRRANVGDRLSELKAVATGLKDVGYTHISLYGFCWGGKVATAAAGATDLFKSVAIVHPAMLDVQDVDAVGVPFGFYPSKVSGMLA